MDDKCAWWAAKCKRPMAMLEDEPFKRLMRDATSGAYQPPHHTKARKCVVHMADRGTHRVMENNKRRRTNGLRPSIAADVWTDGSVSVIAMLQYHIDEVC